MTQREIKFRVWNPLDKEMVLLEKMDFMYNWSKGSLSIIFGKMPDTLANFNGHDFVIMEYTGLRDKYGKEIYEGNVIEYKSNQKELSEVFFDEGSYKITQPSSGITRTLSHHLSKYQCEVIGDIYTTPELLNK